MGTINVNQFKFKERTIKAPFKWTYVIDFTLIDTGNSFLYMAFPSPPPVIETVGYVTGLLNLKKAKASTNGVNCSGWNVDEIPWLYIGIEKHIFNGLIFDGLTKFVRSILVIKAIDKLSTFFCGKHIPAFSFAAAVLKTGSNIIVWVNLDA